MKIVRWLIVGAAMVMLLGAIAALPCDACEGNGCDGKCEGKCDDGCKCKGKCDGESSNDPRYSDSALFGFVVKKLANGLSIVTRVEEEGVGRKFGLRMGDILLSANGKEIGEFSKFLKAFDSTDKAPLAVRVLRRGQVQRLHQGKCHGKCGDDCKCGGKCGEKCDDGCECGGKCDDGCKCGGKCGEKCDDGCKCGGKCDDGCGEKGGCHGKEKAVKAPQRIKIQDLLGIVPALCDNGTLMVKDLEAGKSGSKMGIEKGDVILAVNGMDVTEKNRMIAILVSPGKNLSFLILRGNKPLRMCGGKCGKENCDGCMGRCKGGCGSGSGCGGCGGGCGGHK